jgi:hypothetical protein
LFAFTCRLRFPGFSHGYQEQRGDWEYFAESRSGPAASWTWKITAWETGIRYNHLHPERYGSGTVPALPFDPQGISIPEPGSLTATWKLDRAKFGTDLKWTFVMGIDSGTVTCKKLRFFGVDLPRTTVVYARQFTQGGIGIGSEFSTPLPKLGASLTN